MSLTPQQQILKRIAITLGLGVAFIVMASIFSPERSRASEDSPRRRQQATPRRDAGANGSSNAHEGLQSLGVIESGRYSIAIYATEHGPRYTIIANDSGDEIGTLLTPAQVEQLLPDVDLKSMDFSGQSATSETQQMMLGDPQG